jgi:hypothetical protein
VHQRVITGNKLKLVGAADSDSDSDRAIRAGHGRSGTDRVGGC